MGGGDGLCSNSVCIANGLIYKAYTVLYKDTVIIITNSYSAGQEVKYLAHEERACIVCSLYEPVHETYHISTKASNNHLFWLVQRN